MIIDPTSQQEFSDADFAIVDNADQSRKLKFDVSGVPANTTVVFNFPVGTVLDYGGSTVPAGYLLAAGQNVLRAAHPALFAVYGTTFGAGDGSTTFGLPDLRGRVVAGKDNMNGSAASRLTTGGQAAINGSTLGAAGGAQDNTLDTTRIPAHAHGVTDPGHNHSQNSHNHSQNAHQHFTVRAESTLDTTPATSDRAVAREGTGGTTSEDYTLVRAASGVNANVGESSPTTAVNVAATATNIANNTDISINNAGGGGAHNNVQPTMVLNKIIYAGV